MKRYLSIITLIFSFSLSGQTIEKPRGCFAGTNGTNPLVLAHHQVNGVLITEKWANIETSPGVYNFTNLLNRINEVKSAGLKYALAVAGGAFGSPSWLIDSLNTTFHSFNYQNKDWKLPIWWNSICSTRLNLLSYELGKQFASDSFLSHVYVTQMTVNGIEGHLNGVNMASFGTDGYSDDKWIEAARTTSIGFAKAFPNKPIVFEVHEINKDTSVPHKIIEALSKEPTLCQRFGLAMWWISGKTSYQPNLLQLIENFSGDKYAQVIGRSDQKERFKDSNYHSVFDQAKQLGIRYIEPWPYEFQHHTYDSLMLDFNLWARANFTASDSCDETVSSKYLDPTGTTLSFYPNPSEGRIYIQTQKPYNRLIVTLLTIDGIKIQSVINPIELDYSSLPRGIYLLRWQLNSNLPVTKKLWLQ